MHLLLLHFSTVSDQNAKEPLRETPLLQSFFNASMCDVKNTKIKTTAIESGKKKRLKRLTKS